ncbi:uncharacterized protein CC84DRAFT_1210870 [Paraphaeosphaeria sporulosa]|uniref:Metalloendopeptidase n=1 Tax=Paraphaeosphaeria sporulosa TaxID=1460663 RepID=A0A177CWJ9_9PLEO|nr:uncharacterized protein CC84DRAFT_1210870 [Paraphaeosphaeria sporulosa]OAG11197.1 hypothetical protein CC84DRAFT_1210870 [Paraphaeosphaeria sporulosa]
MKLFTQILGCAATTQLVSAIISPIYQPHNFSTGNTSLSTSNHANHTRRYAEYLSSGYSMNLRVSPWPMRSSLWHIDTGYLRTIPYCFVDQRSYEKIGDTGGFCKIRGALGVWAEALNGGADAISGHALGFRFPAKDEGFCCTNYRYGAENQPRADSDFQCDWDHDKWPSDTLAVHWVDEVKSGGIAASATIGYVRTGDPYERPGRHWIRVSDGASPGDIAHEVGHAVGMAHEHQRWDRDDHVEFRCANLVGMSDIINHYRVAAKVDYATASKALCEDQLTAEKWFAPSAEYVRGAGLDVNTKPKFDGPGGFDVDSIMLYDSYSFSKAGYQVNVGTSVLVAIERDADGNKVPGSEKMFPRNTKPSPKDVEFVKTFYPWDAEKYQEYRKAHPEHGDGRKRERDVFSEIILGVIPAHWGCKVEKSKPKLE